MTDTDTVMACPECDSCYIERVSVESAEWYCRECESHFDDPTKRPAKVTPRDCRSGLARKLADADPNEVGQ